MARNIMVELFCIVFFMGVLSLGQSVKQQSPLDNNKNFNFTWELNENQDQITFEVTVRTLGFIGFGIAPKASMMEADLIIGGVYDDGTTYFQVFILFFQSWSFKQRL